jgi:Hsp70-interacting protein N N-terminal domain
MSMSFDLPQSALEQLKGFIMLCRTKPEILHKDELAFFREYLTSLGARLPPAPEPAQKERKPEPKPAAAPEESAPADEVGTKRIRVVSACWFKGTEARDFRPSVYFSSINTPGPPDS